MSEQCYQIAPTRRATVQDVVSVSLYGLPIVLPPASSVPGKKERDGGYLLTDFVSRSAIFSTLVNISQRNGNEEKINALVEYLNNTSVPVTFKDVLVMLTDLNIGDNKSIFNIHGIDGPVALRKLSSESSFYSAATVGTGSLLAAAASTIAKVLDSVSALSCEAAGFKSIDSFDSSVFETSRPHRGQILSAATLRLLLEGSKRCTNASTSVASLSTGLAEKSTYSASVFSKLPQTIGPNTDLVAIVGKVMDIELNAADQWTENGTAVFSDTQSALAIEQLTAAFDRMRNSSAERLEQLLSSRDPSRTTDMKSAVNEIQNSFLQQNAQESILHKGFASLQALVNALVDELFESLSILDALDSTSSAAAGGSEPQKEKAIGDGAARGKPELDESHLTPEQRAKAEAKRKAKADKAASKAQLKESKKALTLGAGTSVLRSYLAGRVGSGAIDKGLLYEVLNPFDLSASGFAAQCAKVVEQLNAGGKRKPKIPKGARDFTPEQMRIREQAFAAIRRVFKRHGGVEIDTPVFELKEVLTGKYGEDSKLIYDLADQGGELLSLRYDLTVPFARFLSMNSVGNIKRYHIAKVYRRDQPQLARGRYREFYQCDFDIAGTYSSMVADAEVISVAAEILRDLPVGAFLIKLNHRKLLDAIFDICGVPAEKFRPICSAVDKLDKLPWEEVKVEMVEEKGLPAAVADRIGQFVLFRGEPQELWTKLSDTRVFGDHALAAAAMSDLNTLFKYLDAMGTLKHVSFDLSLARGLDYYTGVIYEAVLTEGTSQVGSIAAGGRYDNLVGMFSPSGVQTPCVGVSIGIERVFTIMEKKAEQLAILQSSNIQVYIASIGPDLICERMRIAQALWGANISSEFSHLDNPKFKKQLDDALERAIPYMVVFGQDEIDKGVVKVKYMASRTEVEVPRDELVSTLIGLGCSTLAAGVDLSFIDAMKVEEGK